MSNRSVRPTRRTIIKSIATAGVTMPLVMPRLVRAESPNEKLNIAFIGTGGRGAAHIHETSEAGHNCTAYCDVDEGRQGDAAELWPEATAYQDYRRMFDREQNNIDAVFIATPDHHHYPAAMIALQHDIHVYCEKPLTWGVWEARKLAEEAAKRNVATQMGNQGHAGTGWRVAVAWIQEGAIGDVTEVHTWTNRPIWPQGVDRPSGSDPVPDSLDWDVWLGPAPERPYKKDAYHPFNWRGWFDFGAGALGDMACHTMDGTFWALDPGHPTAVEPIFDSGHNRDSFPEASIIKWEFPERNGRPAFAQYWYDGDRRPPKPYHISQDEWERQRSGNLFVGTKGLMRVWGDYGNSPRLIPEARNEEVGRPENVMDESPGHHAEFFLAARGDKPHDFPKSNFAYAGPMTEAIVLGNVALAARERCEWDGENLKVTNIDEANELIRRQPRQGWDVDGLA